METKVLTIIPARGGSKSVPKKNIKMLAGKPLIAWTIEAAKQAKLTGRVIVSTDSEEIAEIARSYGAEVPFLRPAEISQDLSTDLEFVLHALKVLKEKEGYEPDIVARFSPTTPLRGASVMDATIQKLIENPDIDSVRPISRLSHHPYKAWKLDGDFLVPAFPKEVTGHEQPHNMPRQLFPEMYGHLGASGAAWTRVYTEGNSTSGNKVKYFIMDDTDALDINHPMDFAVAEMLMRERLSRHE
jgi:CMP-N,N'-diacetyllegionaminic acid synthase